MSKQDLTYLELLEKILAASGLNVSNNKICIVNTPVMIAGKQFILPTNEVLRNPDWDHNIAFHPLSENVMRGESVVIQTLRQWMTFTLNYKYAGIVQTLVEVAANVDAHKSLTSKQSEFLSLLPDADARTVKDAESLLKAIDPETTKRYIGIYLKRNGEFKGKPVKRLGVVHCPIMNEANNPDRTIYGVKFRKNDYAAMFKLFEFIMPDSDKEAYNYGSDEAEAPYFHALCNSYIKAAKQLNSIVRAFRSLFGEDYEDMLTDVSWEASLKDLSKYRGLIPNLRGNEGALDEEEERRNAQAEAQEEEMGKISGSYAPGNAAKGSWGDKAQAAAEATSKVSFTEAVNNPAPAQPQQAAPTWGTPAPTAGQPTGKKDFVSETRQQCQQQFGGGWGAPQPQTASRQPTPYGVTGGWGQQQQQQPQQQGWPGQQGWGGGSGI